MLIKESRKKMKIYLAGVIQGSHRGASNENQCYRNSIKDIILRYHPYAKIICPWELFPNSAMAGTQRMHEIIDGCVDHAKKADIVVAYLPVASMGTAVELWESYHIGIPNIIISPMQNNLLIQKVANVLVRDMEQFEKRVLKGVLDRLLAPSRIQVRRYQDRPIVAG